MGAPRAARAAQRSTAAVQLPAAGGSGLHPVPVHAMQPGARVRSAPSARRTSYPAAYTTNRRMVLLCLVLAAAVVFGLVLVNIYVAQSSFRLNDLQAQVAQQEARQRRLRFEIAASEAPDKIAAAGASLGLVTPVDPAYLQGPGSPASSAGPPGRAGGGAAAARRFTR